MEVNNNIFDTSKILNLVLKNFKTLSIIAVLSIIFSVVLYYSLTPRYRSSVILFPSSSGSISQSLVADNSRSQNILKFGEQEEVEQLLQILVSSEMRNRVIDKFDLFSHYNIDRNSKYANTNLYKQYSSNVHLSKTKYMSIEIEVTDCDPRFAADVANSFIEFADSTISKIQRERAFKAYEIVKNEYEYQKHKVEKISDSLGVLGQMGIISVDNQIDKYSEQYAIALASGNTRGGKELELKLEPLAVYGVQHSILTGQMRDEVKRLGLIESKYREALIDLDNDLPKVFVVSKAEVSDRHFYPKLLPLLIINMLSFSVLALFALAFYEKRKSVKI